jgi:TonB family protein
LGAFKVTVAGAFVLVTLLAGPATADPPAGEQEPASPVSVTAFYPVGALAAGVEGQALILCHPTERRVLADCTVTSESPRDQGFGAAALAIAAAAPPAPVFNMTETGQSLPFQFSFKAHPTSVLPDLLHPSMRGAPNWISRPSGDQISATYPRGALVKGVSGRVVMKCVVDAGGGMTNCGVESEDPAGLGFGDGALKLARRFKLSTFTDDGWPTVGANISIPIRWVAPPP